MSTQEIFKVLKNTLCLNARLDFAGSIVEKQETYGSFNDDRKQHGFGLTLTFSNLLCPENCTLLRKVKILFSFGFRSRSVYYNRIGNKNL